MLCLLQTTLNRRGSTFEDSDEVELEHMGECTQGDVAMNPFEEIQSIGKRYSRLEPWREVWQYVIGILVYTIERIILGLLGSKEIFKEVLALRAVFFSDQT